MASFMEAALPLLHRQRLSYLTCSPDEIKKLFLFMANETWGKENKLWSRKVNEFGLQFLMRWSCYDHRARQVVLFEHQIQFDWTRKLKGSLGYCKLAVIHFHDDSEEVFTDFESEEDFKLKARETGEFTHIIHISGARGTIPDGVRIPFAGAVLMNWSEDEATSNINFTSLNCKRMLLSANPGTDVFKNKDCKTIETYRPIAEKMMAMNDERNTLEAHELVQKNEGPAASLSACEHSGNLEPLMNEEPRRGCRRRRSPSPSPAPPRRRASEAPITEIRFQ